METPIQDFFNIQKELDSFTEKFNALVTHKKRQIIDDKTNYSITISDLQNEELKLKNQIKVLNEQQQETKKKIEEGLINLDSRQQKIDELKQEEKDLKNKKQELDEELNELNNQINELNDKINKISDDLSEQVNKDVVELAKFEKYLGLKLQVMTSDTLRFKFINLDTKNIDKEFWVELKLSEFKITNSFPALTDEELEPIMHKFKAEENFKEFLKLTRSLLKKNI